MEFDWNPHPTRAIETYGANAPGGRDFVIGDLHGELTTLEHALDALGFTIAPSEVGAPRRHLRMRAPNLARNPVEAL